MVYALVDVPGYSEVLIRWLLTIYSAIVGYWLADIPLASWLGASTRTFRAQSSELAAAPLKAHYLVGHIWRFQRGHFVRREFHIKRLNCIIQMMRFRGANNRSAHL
jgi:hypothetical protein